MRLLWGVSLLAAVIVATACGHVGGSSSANPAGELDSAGTGRAVPGGSRLPPGTAAPTALAVGKPHTAPPLSSLQSCSLMTFATAQTLTSSSLDPQTQPAPDPATGMTGCTWLPVGSGPTVGLDVWQNPPPANDYDVQFAEAKYLVTAKRCPGAYYRVVSGLGDRAFASYCTTNDYDSNNEQSVTWQFGDLLLSVSILGDSTAQDRIADLIAAADKISSQL